jgi:mono/diheme cytochrome c family protein
MLLEQRVHHGNGDAMRERERSMKRVKAVCCGAILSCLGTFATVPGTVALPQQDVTFTRDVAPILQEKCQVCHQPDSIAPFPLLTYDDARRVANLVKDRVTRRIMPPWHINRTVGIQDFKNDRGLTDEQIATIVAWVEAGTPEGNPADMPPPRVFPDPRQWQLANEFGDPDLIVKSEPYTLAAETQDKWFRPVVDTGLTEPRWVKAIEIKPSFPDGRRIVHHVLTYLEQEEQGITGLASTAGNRRSAGLFMEWAVGKTGEIFPDGAGKLMLPGSRIRWEVHMHAIGEEIVDNQVELGIWFYPESYTPTNRTILTMFDARGERGDLDIPPGEISVTQQFHRLSAPARLENFQPHMHMRGKAMKLEAVYPDGRQEVLSLVDNFQWNWHNNYIYADDAAPLLPQGTILIVTAWHDNTADNPNNPDPEQWVGWGDRTVDEMAHLWVDVTYLEQEQFEELVAEREARKEQQRRDR